MDLLGDVVVAGDQVTREVPGERQSSVNQAGSEQRIPKAFLKGSQSGWTVLWAIPDKRLVLDCLRLVTLGVSFWPACPWWALVRGEGTLSACWVPQQFDTMSSL